MSDAPVDAHQAYRVVLLNDDLTPMEFVVYVLERMFDKPRTEAVTIMLHIHQNGSGVGGAFTREVAEAKAADVIQAARLRNHPLQCVVEEI